MNKFLNGKNSNSSNRGNSFVRDYLSFVFKDPEIALRGFCGRDNNDLKDIDKITEHPKTYPNADDLVINRTKKEFEDILKQFVNTLYKEFKENDLINLQNNIENIRIYYKYLRYRAYKGVYIPDFNEILLSRKYLKRTIIHELFHLASNLGKIELTIFGGFRIISEDFISIGEALDEGYTDIMTYRYGFDEEDKNLEEIIVYKYEYLVAQVIEFIVGQKIMEKLYLNANLYGLIQILCNYADKQQIEEFIKDFDYILNKVTYQKNKNKINVNRAYLSNERIVNFLIDIFYEKHKDSENYDEELLEFKRFMTEEIPNGVYIYRLTTEKYIDNYLDSKKTYKK